MNEPTNEILKSISLDKYYKIIPMAGIIFVFIGASYNQSKLIHAGILTFLYGVWAWMIGAFFHIKADIKLGIFNKWSPLHSMAMIIAIIVISFVTYCAFILTLFFG